jgi:hypothetical protein
MVANKQELCADNCSFYWYIPEYKSSRRHVNTDHNKWYEKTGSAADLRQSEDKVLWWLRKSANSCARYFRSPLQSTGAFCGHAVLHNPPQVLHTLHVDLHFYKLYIKMILTGRWHFMKLGVVFLEWCYRPEHSIET